MQAYSDPSRETDPYAMPNVEVFQLTADETAVLDEDMVHEYLKRFPLAAMNGRDRSKMIDAMIEENEITGGWFYWFCFPGCMPDSEPIGPFATRDDALADAQDND